MNWTCSRELTGKVVPKRRQLMNEEAKNLYIANSCQLNGGSFVTVVLSSAASSSLSTFGIFVVDLQS